jgi:hypothetical protein
VRLVLARLLALLLASALCIDVTAAAAQITVDAPSSLASAAQRVREVNLSGIAGALARAGLDLPSRIHVTLIPEDDPRARVTPTWTVGLASGRERIAIFPDRVGSYPYGSLESVVRHEIAHLSLATRAGGRHLPRWFHEGVAVSVETGWGVGGQLRLWVATLRNPAIGDLGRLFASDAQPDAAEAYLLATALVEDLRARHRADVPGAIAARVALGLPFDAAFRIETGDTPDQAAARAWARYARSWTWVPLVTSASAVWAGVMVLAFVVYGVRRRHRMRQRQRWDEEEET